MVSENVEFSNISLKLDQVVFWLRMAHSDKAREFLQTILDSEKKKRVYELSNGRRTVREIVDVVGGSTGTIPKWWQRWKAAGIVRESLIQPGRMEKLIDLDAFDLQGDENGK